MGIRESENNTMRTLITLSVICALVMLVSASPSSRLGCSIQEALDCANEIQTALEDCSHLTDTSSIVVCVNDILGASDCGKCLCDFFPSFVDNKPLLQVTYYVNMNT